MLRDDIKLLKVFEITLTYYEVTKELVKKLKLEGEVKFLVQYPLKNLMKEAVFANNSLVEGLLVKRTEEGVFIYADKMLYKFPDDASEMFSDCGVLDLDLSNFDTSNVINMDSMFEGVGAVGDDYSTLLDSELNLSSFDTSNVVSMWNMFHLCSAEIIGLNLFDTSQVDDMGCMFRSYLYEGTLDLSGFNTSNVGSMASMFDRCRARKLILSSFDTSNVAIMESMFAECEVVNLDISNFKLDSLENADSMFFSCKAKNIVLGEFKIPDDCSCVDIFEDSVLKGRI